MKSRINAAVEPPATVTLDDLSAPMATTVRLSIAFHVKPHRFREACRVLSEVIGSHPLVSVTLVGIGHTNDLISLTISVGVGSPTEIRHRDSRTVASLVLLDDLITSLDDFAPCFVDEIDPSSDEAHRAAALLAQHADNDLPYAFVALMSKGTVHEQ